MALSGFQKFSWYFRGVILFFLYVFLNAILVIFTLPLLILFLPFPNVRAKILSAALRLVLRIVFLWGIEKFGGYKIHPIKGLENIQKESAIYISNHASLFDPFWAMSFIPNSGVLIKSIYGKILAIWYLVKVFDFIEVDATSQESLGAVIEKSEKALLSGRNLLIFPEGTRTLNGKVGDFKSFAFRLSKKVKAPIIPMAICTDVPFFAKFQKTIIPEEFANIEIEFMPAMNPDDYRDAETMSATAHRLISRKVRGRLFKKNL